MHHSRLRRTDENHTTQEDRNTNEEDIQDNTVIQPAGLTIMEHDSETGLEQSPANEECAIDEQDSTLTLQEEHERSAQLKAGQTIIYTDREFGELRTAQILSRATGKATGKHKDWYNLQYIHCVSRPGTSG